MTPALFCCSGERGDQGLWWPSSVGVESLCTEGVLTQSQSMESADIYPSIINAHTLLQVSVRQQLKEEKKIKQMNFFRLAADFNFCFSHYFCQETKINKFFAPVLGDPYLKTLFFYLITHICVLGNTTNVQILHSFMKANREH